MFQGCCCTDDQQAELVTVDILDTLQGRNDEEPKEEKAQEEPKKEEPKKEPQKEPEPIKQEPKAQPKLDKPLSVHTFSVQVEKSAGPLGMVLDVKNGALVVIRVYDGTIKAYNDMTASDKKIEPNDYIVDINGQITKDNMLREVKQATGTVTLKVARPLPFTIKINRGDKPFGAGLGYQQESCSIDLKEIRDGALKDYNDSVPHSKKAFLNDCIIAINGKSDTPDKMIEIMQSSTQFEVTLVRPPPRTLFQVAIV
mmetsp:Transcript_21717/g.74658  ORF Transcript_21717/g.74658 Transcript_21717/m.74658 type:complete len:255 (-) Transcript_21717:82-846(-)